MQCHAVNKIKPIPASYVNFIVQSLVTQFKDLVRNATCTLPYKINYFSVT